MATVDQVFSSRGLWKWYTSTPTNLWDGISEKGQDFSNSYGTPIGAVAPGKVVALQHNNNAINDIVVVQGNSGYWLYQHITANVHLGDNVGVGSVVGTQNGMPPDQYSTGTHIEVRYLPAGGWKGSIQNTWNQSWINPSNVFKQLGKQEATQVGSFTTSGGGQPAQQNCSVGDVGCYVNNWWSSSVAPTLVQYGEYIAVFTLAIILVIMGFYLIAQKQVDAVAKKAAKVAMLA